MRMWEIREKHGRKDYDDDYHGDYRMGMRDKSTEEAYECGYEDGYEAAMKEIEMDERSGMRSYRSSSYRDMSMRGSRR